MTGSRVQAAIDGVFITDELHCRPPKKTDYLQEKLALQDLALQMVDQPDQVLPHLVDLALKISGGISGGISLYEEHPAPGLFRWRYLRGLLESFSGATMPRDFSPCGVCLDLAAPVLARHPERIYSWLGEASISLPEVLLAPLYRGDLPLGTLWIVSEQEGHFDSGHSRILTELAAFAGKAVHMLRTEQRLQQALEQQETLTQEMSHRVKNLFAITNSLIHFSARAASTPAEMSKLLSGRLNALADAHALVLPSFDNDGTARQGADLGKLIRTVLLPHEGAALPMQPARFEIAGLPIRLGEHATSGLALVFHELATNAVKHGALKNDAGLVQVSWQQHDGVLAIAWREHGGPPIEAAPTRNGFGSILSRRTIVDQLGGTLGHDWQPQGLHVAISVPVGNLSD